ncbi:FemAB family XrtA/PEP-CTERM system-associated protein [Colwellia sp. E2M01]|uniref:FemAB family XrtA/PEP-CTERM system-associated protein n=1 Tax=Colwellia sp. E2M01 TaxID=2841561 RepID=UPI001C094D6F|nr:FemAB family XrtA/PEP-CTERM system-associated protein [Colwellia sp. E2M01]MBU2869098.1 FemAB family PEP-CTERM system-associated protein [Colwellia sp. E2M01]
MLGSEVTIQQISANESALWDEYVQQHVEHSPYHLFSWLAAVELAYSHQVYYFVAKQDSVIVGILPLVNIRIPLKGSSLCSLPFCDVGGCLADNDEIKNLLEANAVNLKSKLQSKSIEYRERTQISNKAQFEGKKVSMLLPLPATSDELFAGFKSKLRSQIRKAEKNGLTYELGISQKFIDEFYAVFSENMHRLGSPVHSKKWIESICKQYNNQCIIAIVRLDNVAVGAGIVLFTDQKACIPWASTRAEYNRLSPNMMLYWELLKFVTDKGCTEFDFGRSTFNEGTYRFKQQWGAEPILLEWREDPLNQLNENTKSNTFSVRAIIENIWKKLPLSLVNIIGPLIRKYITL